jgi:Flp pilus assembly protein TadD
LLKTRPVEILRKTNLTKHHQIFSYDSFSLEAVMTFRFIIHAATISGLLLTSGSFYGAAAQNQPLIGPGKGIPAPLPAVPVRSSNQDSLTPILAPPAQLPPLTREQRQQAYAKLLEGQRYLWSLQNLRSQTGIVTNGRLARAALQKSVEFNPGLAESYTALAELAFFTQNDSSEIQRLAGIAVKLDRNNFGSRLLLARIYSSQSRLFSGNINKTAAENAISEWTEVARLDPRNAEAWAFLSDFYAQNGQSDKQIEALENWSTSANSTDDRFYRFVTRKDSLSPETATIQLGKTLLKNGKPVNALSVLSRAITDNPENSEALAAFKDALEKASPEEAAKTVGILQQAVPANPSNPGLVTLLANLQIRAGHFDEAVKILSSARKRFPDDQGLLQLEASALTEVGRVDDGVALLRSKIVNKTKQIAVPEALENDFILNITISRLYLQAGRSAEAISAAQQALILANDSRMTNIALLTEATAQNAAGDFKSAEISLREILKQTPNHAMALNNLGYFMIERNERLPEAIELIKQAVEREPNNPTYLDSLGWANFKLGQFTEAEKNLLDADRLAPNSAAIQHHLGDLYQKQGKAEQARSAWRKALSTEKNSTEIKRLKLKLGESKKGKQ